MRWIALMFLAVTIMVPIGFYLQAHGNFRGRGKLEPWPKLEFPTGKGIALEEPVAICSSRALCAEARRMSRRAREAADKRKEKDLAVARDWFKQLDAEIKFAKSFVVIHSDPRYTEVKIVDGPAAGFQGFAYTVALEEAATGKLRTPSVGYWPMEPEGEGRPATPAERSPAPENK